MMAATWRLLASASSFRMCSSCWDKRSNKGLCLRWRWPSFQGQNNCDAAVMFHRSSTRTRPFVSPCKPSSSSAGPQLPSASEEKTSYKQRQAEHLMHWFLKIIVIVFPFATDFSFIVIDCIYLPICFVCPYLLQINFLWDIIKLKTETEKNWSIQGEERRRKCSMLFSFSVKVLHLSLYPLMTFWMTRATTFSFSSLSCSRTASWASWNKNKIKSSLARSQYGHNSKCLCLIFFNNILLS